jgi:hypothetical protein
MVCFEASRARAWSRRRRARPAPTELRVTNARATAGPSVVSGSTTANAAYAAKGMTTSAAAGHLCRAPSR